MTTPSSPAPAAQPVGPAPRPAVGRGDGAAPSDWILACLCAGWCGTCESYLATFRTVAARHAAVRCVWIDIEAHSDALGDDALDIENFPTLMLLGPMTGPMTTPMTSTRPVLFYGAVLPHIGTLERLVQAALSGSLSGVAPPALAAAVAALAAQLQRC